MYRILLYITVIVHILILVMNCAAFFALPFYVPWYIWVPLNSFLIRLATVAKECPLTSLENYYREKCGYRKIGTFIGHYVVRPIKVFLKIKKPR